MTGVDAALRVEKSPGRAKKVPCANWYRFSLLHWFVSSSRHTEPVLVWFLLSNYVRVMQVLMIYKHVSYDMLCTPII